MMLENLSHNIKLLQKQVDWLNISFDEVKKIGIKSEYSIEEFGKFETLCSRFARSIDFLVRKVFRSIDEFEFEIQGTLIDVVNNAHKRGLFDKIIDIRTIQDIRNTIAHEYLEDDLKEIFGDIILYTPKLIAIMQNTIEYVTNKYSDEIENKI